MTASLSRDTGRVLLLSAAQPVEPGGGRAMLSRTNHALLRDLFGERLVSLSPSRPRSRRRDAWRGHVDGIDDAFLDDLLALIAEQQVDRMFVDGSNFGAAVAAVKRRKPHVRIVTLFHNVEARFFWGALRARPSPKALAVLVANFVAERRAVRGSDVLVTLSARDGVGLARLYGRGADAIAPMVLEDRAPASPTPSHGGDRYLLFVGGGFYANVDGIRWFAHKVVPRVGIGAKVVGRGMEGLTTDLAAISGVELVGAVDDLSPWYAGALLVIAPIFDGSGMKTKVAEALMHGKHVAGTPEAFSGYAADVVMANQCCPDADAFVAAIDAALATPPPAYDPAMRTLYERDHSPAAARKRLAAIMDMPDRFGGISGG